MQTQSSSRPRESHDSPFPPRLTRLKDRRRQDAAGDFIWSLLVKAGGVRKLSDQVNCSAFAIQRLATVVGLIPRPRIMQRLADLSGRSLNDVQSIFGPRPRVPSRGQHLVMLNQQKKHLALSANAPLFSKLVRAAVDQQFHGNYESAATACRRSPDDHSLGKNHLWEIARGWKYIYGKKNGHRVRHRRPLLYPSENTIDRLSTGLSLNRQRLIDALPRGKDKAPLTLERRRHEIARWLNRPLSKISNPYERKAKKQQIAQAADRRRGKGTNPKTAARLSTYWDDLEKKYPTEYARALESVAPNLAKFHHPTPTQRMKRGWGILKAWCRRQGRSVSTADVDRFVGSWSGRLGLKPKLVIDYVARFQKRPPKGWEPDLDLYLSVRVMKDAGLTWNEIVSQLVVEHKVKNDPQTLRRAYGQFANLYFQNAKLRLRPFLHRRRWSPQEIAELRNLYTAGATIDELTARFESTRPALKTLASRLGFRRMPTP